MPPHELARRAINRFALGTGEPAQWVSGDQCVAN